MTSADPGPECTRTLWWKKCVPFSPNAVENVWCLRLAFLILVILRGHGTNQEYTLDVASIHHRALEIHLASLPVHVFIRKWVPVKVAERNPRRDGERAKHWFLTCWWAGQMKTDQALKHTTIPHKPTYLTRSHFLIVQGVGIIFLNAGLWFAQTTLRDYKQLAGRQQMFSPLNMHIQQSLEPPLISSYLAPKDFFDSYFLM